MYSLNVAEMPERKRRRQAASSESCRMLVVQQTVDAAVVAKRFHTHVTRSPFLTLSYIGRDKRGYTRGKSR